MNTGVLDRIRGIVQQFALAAGRRCLICGRRIVQRDSVFPELCPDCLADIRPQTRGYCPGCGMCYPSDSMEVYLCSDCRRSPRPWSSLGFFGPYSGLVRSMITDFKFNARLPLVTLLGRMLLQGGVLHDIQPADVIVPVPLHPRRLQERGFNQSLELARRLVPVWGPEVDVRSLVRVRNTRAQRGLGKKARRSNLKGAFAVRGRRLENKRVLLVDDVMTTGSTLTSCARALRACGAGRVDVLVVARA
ncbi:ComF family protein [Desulfoplanes formicivorans]|uniref:Phosphoribosyltransferase n=1 Tax=Desulfoplanes formicivorans TaxID=1592317 RepID=A0A194AEI5_9BACT|nr:ComF family protein [Desulfoplanes formicivorans]GAU07738.1 phosphoribosyltransferase [Desulfoplanes formicivorans]